MRPTTSRCASSARTRGSASTALREAMPNIPIQMLLRGRNTVGYTPYPAEVTDAFVREAAATGVDIFRIFDALNDVSQMRPAIDAVLETGTAVAEVAVCYTGDLLDPAEDLYTLDYYLRLAEQIVEAGAHILAIKDMAGLLRPAAASPLVSALRERFDLPVHVHTHDTAGGQLATLLAASAAGADAVDAAAAPMSGTTSQPSLSALVAALAHTERDTGLDLHAVSDLEPYWEAVRHLYRPFESGLAGPHRPRLPPRDPGRAALEPAPAGDRARPRRRLRAHRGHVRRRRPHPRPHPEGDAVVEGRRRPRAAPRRGRRPIPPTSRRTRRTTTSPTRSSASWRASSATCPADGPSRSAPRCSQGREVSIERHAAHARTSSGARRRRRDAPPHAQPAAVPRRRRRSSSRSAKRTATCRALGTADYLYGLKPGEEHVAEIDPRRAAVRRARGDRRGRRQGHAHRHDHAERPAAPGVRAGPQHQGRRRAGGEGRHVQARPGRRAVLGRRHAQDRRSATP